MSGEHARKVVIVGNGRQPVLAEIARVVAGADLVVGADGGALKALDMGLELHVAVGDADSVTEADLARLSGLGVPFHRSPAAKDQSDLELALRLAVSRGASEVVLLAALDGSRLEHTLANVALLALPELAGRDVCIVDERSTVRLLQAAAPEPCLTLSGEIGDFVSLVPMGADALGVETDGLRYPLRGERLAVGESRGLSNELIAPNASVRLSQGQVLVVHTRRRAEPVEPGRTAAARKEPG